MPENYGPEQRGTGTTGSNILSAKSGSAGGKSKIKYC